MSEPKLVFKMPLPDISRKELISGILYMTGTEKDHEFYCTSGQPGYQFSKGTRLKGKGPLPGCQVLGIPNYTVSTSSIWMPQVKGVQGNFFAISPHMVNIKGVTRGDFGVHNDVNRSHAPGSAGCIVFLFDLGWQIFQQGMTEFRLRNIKQVPLVVEH